MAPLICNTPQYNTISCPGNDYSDRLLAWEGKPGGIIPEADMDWLAGEGTADSPYRIDTADQLILLSKASILWNRHFVLGADIDLDPVLPGRRIFGQAVIPVFTGVFDGGGHVISNLVIEGSQNLGLFGHLTGEAEVKNVGVVDANIIGSGGNVGVLAGHNEGSIATSSSSGSVSGRSRIGGLVGSNYGSVATSSSSNSASGTDDVGGLVGYNWGGINSSSSSGSVSGTGGSVGGLVGSNEDGSINSSFWDIQTSGWTTSAGGTGKTSAEMQSIETFLLAGWDFVDEVANGTCDYWRISPGDYPQLRYHSGNRPLMPEGLGTAEQPYLIRDARDLGTVWFEPLAHYRLAQSVDLSGIRWSMAVIPGFGGSFDGSGYVIGNLHIQGGSYLGLFGHLGSTASVSSLGLEAVEVNGTDSVGGLVGDNEGSIGSSNSSGSISGTGDVGGLVGSNWGSIDSSSSSGSVSGTSFAGGLVGFSRGSIATSHSTGSVNGTDYYIGGLVGFNWATIATSYSSGPVTSTTSVAGGLVGRNKGSINSSFWDIQTSGWTTSADGTGKTTAEMQMAKTFLAAGWDFVGESKNGTEDIWWILEGKDYPRLWWELSQDNMVP